MTDRVINDRSYRPGDVLSVSGPMRLTVGGLAEIVARTVTPDLQGLADQIRAMSPETARHLAAALLRPCGNGDAIEGLSDANIAALMPSAARCVAAALSERS